MLFRLGQFFKHIGPGVITGASDDDPSGVVTYSQAGAKFGYQLLWLALFTMPLMMAVQEMSARLGLVTRRGLAALIRRYISKRVAIALSFFLLIVNTVNIGADLGAMAAVSKLLHPAPTFIYLALFAGLIVALEVLIPYRKYVNVLKWLTFALLAYVATAFFVHVDWGQVAWRTLIPTLTTQPGMIAIIVAILGTTISPYLSFWQSSEEVESELATPRQASHISRLIRTMRIDTVTGMVLSNVIMFFIIVTTAATLHQAGVTNIATAQQAAEALRPIAGNLTFWLFGIGIIGTGLLAVPILAGSAAYALAEVLDWREGLSKHFRQAPTFYAIIIMAIWIGAAMSATGVSPIAFLIGAAILNGLLAPVALWYIIHLADRADVVGAFPSQPIVRVGGWVTWALMTVAGVMYIGQLFIRS